MIEDLRFVKKYVDIGDGFQKEFRILQAYNGHEWFDVPLVDLE